MQKPANVYFPCVGANSGEVVEINCFASKELKGTIKVLSGIEEEAAVNIIGISRQGEHNNNAGLGVIATVSNPRFHGNSYALALAVADKLARYTKCKNINKVYATGEIKPNNNGEIDTIDNINEKLSLVLSSIKRNDVFLFPKQCEDKSDSIQKELLQAIVSKGAKYYPIVNISDGDNIFWCFNANNKYPYQVFIKGLLLFAFVVLLGALFYLILQNEQAMSADKEQLNTKEMTKVELKNEKTVESKVKRKSNNALKPVAVPTNNY